MNILVIINAVLLALVIFMLFIKKSPEKSRLFSELEGMDLIEFQQNLKSLIDELNKLAETKINAMEQKRGEIDAAIKEAENKVNELKYLIERSQLRRQAEYKEAIGEGAEDRALAQAKTLLPFEGRPQPLKEAILGSRMVVSGLEDTSDMAHEAKSNSKDKYQHINALIRNGLSVEEIAKVTGLTRGEIELIRNIKR